MQLYMDKLAPAAWRDAEQFSATVRQLGIDNGLSAQEAEFIKVRASQLNGCAFCLDLHSRQARLAGISQQKLDLVPAWRESPLYTERETAVLAIAEAATRLPMTDDSHADLIAARAVLGDETFIAAEWVAAAINMFNRISILSQHPVRPRGADGKLIH